MKMNNFARFSWNFPHKFIDECWKGNPVMANHLNEKFKDYYDRHKTSGVMLMFYMSLDKANKQILDAYIDEWAEREREYFQIVDIHKIPFSSELYLDFDVASEHAENLKANYGGHYYVESLRVRKEVRSILE